MTLADSLVWIDYFNGVICPETDRLDALLGDELLLTGDLILVEVLQGFRSDTGFRKAHALLSQLAYVDLVGRQVAIAAARNYRLLRRAGVTIRKTIDVAIATHCILNGHRLLYTDRDFDALVEHLGLEAACEA